MIYVKMPDGQEWHVEIMDEKKHGAAHNLLYLERKDYWKAPFTDLPFRRTIKIK